MLIPRAPPSKHPPCPSPPLSLLLWSLNCDKVSPRCMLRFSIWISLCIQQKTMILQCCLSGRVYRLDPQVFHTVWFLSECPQEVGLGKVLWEDLTTYSCPTGWRITCYFGDKQSCTMIPTPLMTKGNGEGGSSLVPLELWELCSLPQNHVRPKWWPSRWLV